LYHHFETSQNIKNSNIVYIDFKQQVISNVHRLQEVFQNKRFSRILKAETKGALKHSTGFNF
jgi:hypothetical protein